MRDRLHRMLNTGPVGAVKRAAGRVLDTRAGRIVRRFVLTIVGVALLAVGLAMMVLPGPGIVLIVAGLAVLAVEYVWARVLLEKAKKQALTVQQAAVSSPLRTAGSVAFAVGMVAVGVAMYFGDFIPWPVLRPTLEKVWSPGTGTVLIVMGLVLIATTVITIRTAKGKPTTYAKDPAGPAGGARAMRR